MNISSRTRARDLASSVKVCDLQVHRINPSWPQRAGSNFKLFNLLKQRILVLFKDVLNKFVVFPG